MDTKTTTQETEQKVDGVENVEVKTDATEETQIEKISMTQDELDKIIQKRLDREKKKAEEEKVEAEKLAKMSEAEKQKALFEKDKAKFEEERKKYQLDKMELELVKQLNSKGLPVEFSKYLLHEEAETCLNNINEFEKTWQTAIENAVNEKLKGNTPKVGSSSTATTTNDNDFINIIKQNQARR